MEEDDKRRRFKRLDTSTRKLNATLAILEENKVTGCLVPIKDFSKSGAGVYIKFRIEPNSSVKLSLEGVQFGPLHGKVVWCRLSNHDPQAPASHPFRAGIDFEIRDDAERENQNAIYDHISKMVGESKE